MQIFINREAQNIHHNTSLLAVLHQFNIYAQSGIAVAVNNEVIPRHTWSDFFVNENDKITVITATQGG